MTPQRAYEFVQQALKAWEVPSATLDDCLRDAILAACAEERRATLEEVMTLRCGPNSVSCDTIRILLERD